jgi:iron only hydrogenase large subunit-like protein
MRPVHSGLPDGGAHRGDETEEVFRLLRDPAMTVIVQTAPAVRPRSGSPRHAERTLVTGEDGGGLTPPRFDYVFDTQFTADLTIMRRDRSCWSGSPRRGRPHDHELFPAWISFIETFYPSLLPHLSAVSRRSRCSEL